MDKTQNAQNIEVLPVDPQTDHNHPLYLQASDAPGVALIPMKLTCPENYGVWSRPMRIALLVKNKLGFVDGTCIRSQYKGAMLAKWERCDDVVLSWSSAAVAPELMTSIVYASSSKRIWEDFKERFDKSNLTRIFYLWKEINMLTQGTDSVTSYYSKMRDIWDEIDAMVPNLSCDCETSMPYVEHLKQQRLLQFLIRLNESFAQVRSSILLNLNIPSVNQAYAMAIQEESQRKLGNTDSGNEPLTMLAGRNSNVSNNPYYNQGPGRASHNQSQAHHQGQSSQGRRSGTVICEHCGFKGHTKDTCYRIIGFPADFKIEAESNKEGRFSFPGGYFTKDQYNEALKKLYPTGSCKANAQAVIKAEDDQRLWHLRLGHPSVGIMKTLKHKDASVSSDHIIDVLPTAIAQPMSSPENSELSSVDPPPDAATLEQVVVNETESATLSQDILVHPDGEAHEPAASPQEEHIVTPPVSRKTGRTSKPPIWIKDYIVPSKSSLYSITDHLDFTFYHKDYNLRNMLLSLLQDATGMKKEINSQDQGNDEVEIDNAELADRLQKSFKGKRYLIVVDDIWSREAWDEIRLWFPEYNNTSRILLTTQIMEVARYASYRKNPFPMRPLGLKESWDLFCQKAFGEKDCPTKFKTFAKVIIENCQGSGCRDTLAKGHWMSGIK
ncbi:hypothetical protein KY284_032222 [Solanum tuberosum]|nr:hypothetical protein KY284_032222 [Solanum tuberosum]